MRRKRKDLLSAVKDELAFQDDFKQGDIVNVNGSLRVLEMIVDDEAHLQQSERFYSTIEKLENIRLATLKEKLDYLVKRHLV